MNAVKRTVLELVVLGLAGLVVGFGYNSVRGKGSLEPSKNYFYAGDVEPDKGDPDKYNDDEPGLKHGYQTISFADVVDVFNDPDTELGLNVFVDARKEEPYSDGHIPGAILCNPYEVDACIDEVMNSAAAADRVIVYCHGGECEDSVFMCRELLAVGVEYSVVYVFEGGWEEWEQSGSVPLATGREE